MAYRFAQRTKVDSNRSKVEIESMLRKRGASSCLSGEHQGQFMLVFEMRDRRLKFIMPLLTAGRGVAETKAKAENRRRYRALLLVLKAKLEAVDSKIVEFESEFLAHIVFAGNETVGERMVPQMRAALVDKELPPLLGAGSEG